MDTAVSVINTVKVAERMVMMVQSNHPHRCKERRGNETDQRLFHGFILLSAPIF
jgi:hypothetical protein